MQLNTQKHNGSENSDAATTDEEQTEIRNIQAMIQNSPDLIDAPNDSGGFNGETPLQMAATRGQLVVAKYLLDLGADVDKRAQNGGADPGGSPLFLAAQYGHKTMVELLLARGADVNGAHGPSPLNAAISRGFTAVVDVLLANKADANAWSGFNNGKVLHTAASSGNTNLIQLLIAHGAEVNATDSNSNTPLHLSGPLKTSSTPPEYCCLPKRMLRPETKPATPRCTKLRNLATRRSFPYCFVREPWWTPRITRRLRRYHWPRNPGEWKPLGCSWQPRPIQITSGALTTIPHPLSRRFIPPFGTALLMMFLNYSSIPEPMQKVFRNHKLARSFTR